MDRRYPSCLKVKVGREHRMSTMGGATESSNTRT
jgi:hypothetical protein